MTPLDIGEETVLLGLLAALAVTYVVHRVQLRYSQRDARRIIARLAALEMKLHEPLDAVERAKTIAALERLEQRLTAASRRLIAWRASPIEHWFIGRHIDPLLYDYERAGAMTSRLIALIARQAALVTI